MINSIPKHLQHRLNKNKGAALLLITTTLIVLTTLIVIFAARYGRSLTKISGNQTASNQAFAAADAGLEFGISYFKQNSAAILANPVSGYIPSYTSTSTQNVSLANGSKFSIAYTNPVAANYTLILVTSTGTAADGTTTHVISQKIAQGSTLSNLPTYAITSKGSISMSGNANVTNSSSSTQSITSASTVSLSGNSQTTTSAGTASTAGHIQGDITQNSSTLSGMSQNDFFANFFGTTSTATIKNQANYYYNNSTNTNYTSSLDGKTGSIIWIDQTGGTASISGNATVGSTTNPVLLIVNGSLSISGNLTFYGFIFVIGTSGLTTISGNSNITGGIATSDNLNVSGNMNITFSNSVLNNLKSQTALTYWTKVPGTWKDF